MSQSANVLPLADERSSYLQRAGFTRNHLWVTPYAPEERYPAGEYPNQHAGGAGLPEWTQANREVTNRQIVVWYTVGAHHAPRIEDWPVARWFSAQTKRLLPAESHPGCATTVTSNVSAR